MSKYRCLDLDEVLDIVASYASIFEAKQLIINQEVSFNPLIIRNNTKNTAQALKLLQNGFKVDFDGVVCVDSLLIQAEKGLCLSGNDLYNILVFHNHCLRIISTFKDIDDDLDILDFVDSISINQEVFSQIEKSIDNTGAVKPDASSKMKDLTRKLDLAETDLYNKAHIFLNKHSSSLQESSIFQRDDRICFLVKNSDKNKFKGYTYGSSGSNQAFYVEPSSLIEANNERLNLRLALQEEIARILGQLTLLVGTVKREYERNFDSICQLCAIFAKAKYGYLNGGIIPQFRNDNFFEFKDLAHPLLDKEKVVVNTYALYPPYVGIVISGSNTGGKTVSLKAIGLSTIMAYLGIPIIASSAQVALYQGIYVDIDDNQSIKDSLSTFSAHISNINSILLECNKRSLILIDELISGTDPSQAQAISLAILDKIKEIGAAFIITTHFDEIKKYSYQDSTILLSSVGFDMNTLTPTYKYQENSFGSSNAIDIASRYFTDQSIVKSAKQYLRKQESQVDQLVDKLNKQLVSNEQKEKELDSLKVENQQLKDDYERQIVDFNKQKERLYDDYLQKLNQEIEQLKLTAIEQINQAKESKDTKVIEKVTTKKPKKEKILVKKDFEVGDNVRIKDNQFIGSIISIKDKDVMVDINGMRVKTKLAELTLMPKINKKQKTKIISNKYSRVPSSINLVGKRVNECLEELEEYLDTANAAHMSSVKIIHGFGSGALRKAIRENLAKLSYVKSYKDGDSYDGGSGVTIVEFK